MRAIRRKLKAGRCIGQVCAKIKSDAELVGSKFGEVMIENVRIFAGSGLLSDGLLER